MGMLVPLLRIAAQAMLVAPGVVVLALGIIALRALAGSRLRARPERWAGVALALAAALAVGGLVDVYVASFAGMDSGVTARSYLGALPFAVFAAVVSLLAGLVAYVILSRAWTSRASALGALIGAPLLAGLWLGAGLGSQGLQNAANNAEAAAAVGSIANRSAGITMRADVLEAVLDSQGTGLATVRVRVTLKSDADVAFDTGSKNAWPRFTFTNVGQGQLQLEGTAADPQALVRGADQVWDLTFIVPPLGPYSGTYQVPGPGTWPLLVTFLDSAGAEYNLTTNVDVQPTR